MASPADSQLPPIVILTPGRVGDIVTSEPIFRRAHEAEPQRSVIMVTLPAYAEIMRFCPYIDEIRTVGDKAALLQAAAEFPPGTRFIHINLPGIPLPPFGDCREPLPQPGLFDQTHNLLHTFQHENGLKPTDDTARFYLSGREKPDGLPENYAVFHCVSGGKNRQWPRENWARLAQHCMDAGLPVVEIGFGATLNLTGPNYISRCDGRLLDEIARIILHAKALVGVESGMLHIANALDTFGILVTGTLRDMPEYNLYCGRYYNKENCNFLRFYDRNAYDLPYAVAETVIDRFLSGKPLSFEECEAFCLKEQIRRLQQSPWHRLCDALASPVRKLRQTLQFHKRPPRRNS